MTPGFPFLRDFKDPVVIIGTPFSVRKRLMTPVTHAILADTVSLQVKNG